MQYYRIGSILDERKVNQQKIVFLGMGSLGSLVLGNLVYNWREIVLVDMDNFDPENLERHLIKDRRYLGLSKVAAVKQWLMAAGFEENRITTYQGRAEDILEQHTDADLFVVNIDRRRSNDAVNAFCHQHNLPALYGGVYPMGVGGHVIVVPTPRDACYLCAQIMMGGSYDEVPHEINYGVDPTLLQEDNDLKEVPALHLDINLIAVRMAEFVRQYLKEPGSIRPQVQLNFGGGWEPVVMLTDVAVCKAIVDYAQLKQKIGLVPNMRITRVDDETYAYEVRRATETLALRRSSVCPLHSESIDAAAI